MKFDMFFYMIRHIICTLNLAIYFLLAIPNLPSDLKGIMTLNIHALPNNDEQIAKTPIRLSCLN